MLSTRIPILNDKNIKDGIDDSAKTATNFLSANTDGVMVYDGSGGTQYTPTTVPTGVKNVYIDSDSMDVRDGTNVLASFDAESLKVGASWNNGFTFAAGVVSGVGTYGKISLGTSGSSNTPSIMLRDDNVMNLSAGGNINDASYINLKPNTSGNGDAGDIYIGAGTIETSGYLKVEGHSSPIGTIINGTEVSNKNLSHETAKRLASIRLPVGVWVVTGFVRFPSNANGVRRINISPTDNSNSIDIQISASSNNTMQLEAVKILSQIATTTYYLNAWQNSNTSLTVSDITLRAVRIA